MVGDETDRRDEDAGLAAPRQLVEVREDVRPEPRLAGGALALEGERPAIVREPGAPRDEPRGLEQLVAVRVALGEDPLGERVRGEDDVRRDFVA